MRSVLPAFRSLVARSLIENFDFSQVAAAKKLGTTQASISHYIYSKRGEKLVKQLESSSSVSELVNKIAEGIATNKISPFDAMLHFCNLCEALRSGNQICNWHKDRLDIPDVCDVCPQLDKKS